MIRAVDLFAGAGGTSTGLAQAVVEAGTSLELVAVNHWAVAVETHARNHPWARHLCADLDALNPRQIVPGQLDILVASPECTHHSTARGGLPIHDQSRASAWCVVRWAEALRPRFVLVENVREFATWGPLTLKGRPMKARAGETYRAWVGALESLGYRVSARVLCAADYGDPTTRRRLFVLAYRGKAPAVWPEESHADLGQRDLFGGDRKQWRAAREIIDWTIEGRSIFERAKPLAARTLERIADGLRRFGGEEPFLLGQQSGSVPRQVSRPVPTLATSAAVALIEPFLVRYHGTGGSEPVSRPLPTVTTRDRFGLVEPQCDDIRFRMLQPGELAGAQGFPADYQFAGTRTEVIKQIGNAVPVGTARALCSGLIRRCG